MKEIIKTVAEIYKVLEYFKLVHADIKPDNLLVGFDGKNITDIKLIDFGSSFSYEDPSNI